jgi:hypothetical protein
LTDEPGDAPVVIDSGPVVLAATTDPYDDQEEDDGGDCSGAGE